MNIFHNVLSLMILFNHDRRRNIVPSIMTWWQRSLNNGNQSETSSLPMQKSASVVACICSIPICICISIPICIRLCRRVSTLHSVILVSYSELLGDCGGLSRI